MMTLTRRQHYYERLLEYGMPDVLAASMAEQSPNCIMYGDLKDIIYGFCAWEDTKEGADFWLWVNFCIPE